ncbi:hypothetical protein [Ruminococcus sp.]|jgi:hypothetical protein|uniref:hypothetical protein n=1 Tax=Ruminococcus sp. TaxID=41978 RepID=UPI0025EE00D5|nr:hypothetical protein [Ruminococcus sp.]
MVCITDHAIKRLKQRMGLGHRAALKMAETAFKKGLNHSETRGSLNKYISAQALEYQKKGNCIKVYGEMVYIFGSTGKTETGEDFGVLITAWYIPNEYKNNALKLQKRKKNAA